MLRQPAETGGVPVIQHMCYRERERESAQDAPSCVTVFPLSFSGEQPRALERKRRRTIESEKITSQGSKMEEFKISTRRFAEIGNATL